MQPRILISAGTTSPENYDNAVSHTGGIPFSSYCPPVDTSYDGLLLCGGGDVDPARYGQESRGSEPPDPRRDQAELALIEAYIAAKKPILAICRGQQLLNVALGGTLIQDLPQPLNHFHTYTAEPKGDKAHVIRTAPGSLLARLYGPLLAVNSAHHQAVDQIAPGLRPTAWSEGGVIEAMEHDSLPIFCTQFHPERMSFEKARPDTADGSAIFRWFIEQCS